MFTGCNRSDPVADAGDAGGVPQLAYGTKVSFGLDGNSERFRESGWSKTEEKFTWSEGAAATLRLRISPSDGPVTLKMVATALAREPEMPFQPVEVEGNGKKIADWQIGGDPVALTAAIPPELTKAGGELTITFKTPKATSPKALGINADPRVLGICVLNLELSKG